MVLLAMAWFCGRMVSSMVSEWGISAVGELPFGLLFLSATTATIVTGGQSVFAPLLAAFLIYALYTKAFRKISLPSIGKEWPMLAVLFSYFGLLLSLFVGIHYRGHNEWALTYADSYAYTAQINLLYQTGVETLFTELEKPQYGFTAILRPYHYFEFWLAYLGKLLSGQLGYFVYNLFLVPFLGCALLYQGFVVARTHFRLSFWLAYVAPLAVFLTLRSTYLDEGIFWLLRDVAGIKTRFYKAAFFQNYGSWHFFSYMHGLKLTISALFMFPVVVAYLSRSDRPAWLVSLVMPFVSITYIPFALSVSGIGFVRSLLAKRIVWGYTLPILSVLLIVCFYSFYRDANHPVQGFDVTAIASKSVAYIQTHLLHLFFINFSDFFETYYWPLLFLVVPGLALSKSKAVRCFFGVILLYPLINLHHGLLFKLFLAAFVATFSWVVWQNRWLFLRSHFVILIITILIIRILVLIFGEAYDLFQMITLTLCPLVYLSIYMGFVWYTSRMQHKKTALAFGLMLWVGLCSYGLIKENQRAQKQRPEDKKFTHKVLQQWAPNRPLKTVYFAPFTILPYIHYDRMGAELLHHTDHFYTACMSGGLLSPTDIQHLKKIGGYQLLENLPLSLWNEQHPAQSSPGENEALQFIKHNRVEFVLRKTDYPRNMLTWMDPMVADSAYNHQSDYWMYRLRLQ